MGKIIDADDKSIGELLGGAKYTVDYYQREYNWGEEQADDLLTDLWGAFTSQYSPDDDSSQISGYDGYFLGAVVITEDENSIIDGQQRLTTLLLVLMSLRELSDDKRLKDKLAPLIRTNTSAGESFGVEVEERKACMAAIYDRGTSGGEKFDSDDSESVSNLANRHAQISSFFSEKKDKDKKALAFFAWWLIERVTLVKIDAASTQVAYAIFESMNNRGLRLTPLEMLKGYLLSNVKQKQERNQANEFWMKRMNTLGKRGANAVIAWLRAKYARDSRERTQGATNKDWEQIATELNRWVGKNEAHLKLGSSGDFVNFIRVDMDFFTHWYLKIGKAESKLIPGLEGIFYNAQNGFTLQHPVLLAALSRDDKDEVIMRKLRIVADYLDIRLHRRIFQLKSITQSTMQYAMFLLTKEMRDKTPEQLAEHLSGKLRKPSYSFASNTDFGLWRNKAKVRLVLARICDYIDTASGEDKSRYTDYCKYDIEHIWANRYEPEFGCDNEDEFKNARDCLGGLLLLSKRVNRSLGDKPYSEKRDIYLRENILLAKSLHPDCYQNNPGFSRFIEKSGLPFKPHAEFKKEDLQKRQELYLQIAEQIWNPDRLAE